LKRGWRILCNTELESVVALIDGKWLQYFYISLLQPSAYCEPGFTLDSPDAFTVSICTPVIDYRRRIRGQDKSPERFGVQNHFPANY
jgi:hypothetical protein